jgi:predicted nuclease of predicted toxin-antitoxin system
MSKYLIDVNLPRYFSLWEGDAFEFVVDIDDRMRDSEIWEYAKKRKMTIVSKDADSRERILYNDPPPRFIHIRLGNMKMKEFHRILNAVWADLCLLSERHKLVVLYRDRIEAIG